MSSAMAPLLLLALVVMTDVWVYSDARRAFDEGTPVRWRIGTFVLESPLMWLLGCIVLWVVYFPAYLVSRRN